MIKAENVSFKYNTGARDEADTLKNIDLHIKKGTVTAIIGHTGSGKSTLIQLFNALLLPTSGHIYVNGTDTLSSRSDLAFIRRTVGLVFQYPEYQLFEETVMRDICFGPKNLGLSEYEAKQRALEAASVTGLGEEFLERSPFELSGGQKRRAAIAGVVAMKPEVLVLDEPAAGLDPRGRRDILKMLKKLHSDNPGMTLIFVSHSMDDVAEAADDIIVMNNGTIAMHAPKKDVFARAGELISMGLDVPQTAAIFDRLRAAGLDLPPDIYTPEDGARALVSLLGGDA